MTHTSMQPFLSVRTAGLFFFTLVASLVSSCRNSGRPVRHEPSKQAVTIHEIDIDTLMLQIPNTSGSGKIQFYGDSIVFCDNIYCQVSSYGPDGNFKNVFLGKGRGPGEIKALQEVILTPENKYVLENWNIHVYDRNWKRKAFTKINWNSTKSASFLENNPGGEESGIYEVKYFQNKFVLLDSNTYLFNIESLHPKYNGYLAADNYYKTAHLVAKMDAASGKVTDLMGNYTDVYLKYKYLPNLANWKYDLVQDSVYLTFEIDERIYVMDKDFHPVRSFGLKPDSMKMNYIPTNTFKAAGARYKEDRATKCYFSDIKFIKEKNLLLRVYTTGAPAGSYSETAPQHQRMQVYRGNTLIGDVSVPPEFKVLGYDERYVYADGLHDSANSRVGVYRFRIF
ncbi:hypothetical protein [Hufsiella ginkgonis]|uniref:6-bladed beta-propeller n=1 Tax=Hufsiella ginkgonis TaxID=2695274 RepID=A0A7K1XT21_9SPHI|nr:hypothetical protein [Hufsiella ginkgonis]MXV14070.1 hypothetical protein [Hufsiella ginkgonis]